MGNTRKRSGLKKRNIYRCRKDNKGPRNKNIKFRGNRKESYSRKQKSRNKI